MINSIVLRVKCWDKFNHWINKAVMCNLVNPEGIVSVLVSCCKLKWAIKGALMTSPTAMFSAQCSWRKCYCFSEIILSNFSGFPATSIFSTKSVTIKFEISFEISRWHQIKNFFSGNIFNNTQQPRALLKRANLFLWSFSGA